MRTSIRIHQTCCLLALLWICIVPINAAATDCGECNPQDTAVPPFLSSGANPNLLMIIDNSASMLDPAYVDDASTCFEQATSDTFYDVTYAGYFDATTWYSYDFGSNKFRAVTESTASGFCSGSQYLNSNLCVKGTFSDGEMTAVSGLYATGNMLNWIASSKLDIQKKILTGGKFDSANLQLKMETRGCGNRRFIKKIPVNYSGALHYVTLAVRPPRAPSYNTWTDGTTYSVGDVVTNYDGSILYRATAVIGASSGTGPLDDAGATWVEYWNTRWHDGTYYAAGSLVTNPGDANTIDDGKVYIATAGGTANGTSLHDDSGVDWESYDLTHIEIFKGSATGFNDAACQAVIDEFSSTTPSLGTIKGDIDECMGTTSTSSTSGEADANNAFTHSVFNCWYKAKHDVWVPGDGVVNSTQNACETIYTSGIDPWEITPEDRAYVCFGQYNGDATAPIGYVGRCWKPGEACVTQCKNSSKVYPTGCPNPNQQEVVCGGYPGWDTGGYASVEECVDAAMQDYCDSMEVPEVIDPSDQVGAATGDTDVTWGLPAMLTDSGVVAQLDEPIAFMQGFIEKSAAPEGLVQEYADDIRMGAMVFNDSGSASECAQSSPYVLYECDNPGNKDGGKVIQEIGQSDAHTTDLVNAINGIKANSWTPLAEAFYNAIGYFKQDSALRLNADDFIVGTSPIEYWCQNNNILIVTEGASTADQHADANTLGAQTNDGDSDNGGSTPDCGTLDGSTYLDDLAWYAHNTEGLLGLTDGEYNQTIDTHIVAAGQLRDVGTGECNPETLLTQTAENGGTTLEKADDIASLEAALRRAFASILKRASAGSAASVISATRSGEGAVYQAIFWPAIDGPVIGGIPQPDVTWAGEVHALLVDGYGNLFEDTNGDLSLTDADQRVVFFFNDSTDETMACYGDVDAGTCSGTVKSLSEVNYLWSISEWLAGIDDTAILTNRINYISNEKYRYIFTWNDLDNDGAVDAGEILPFSDSTDWNGLSVTSDRRKVPHDFGVLTDDDDTNQRVNDIVNWVRGKDGADQRSRQVEKPDSFNVTASADNTITWRLGDVIYSTPTAVGKPVEGFHLIYQDESYADFASTYNNRRQMIYFGGNDGMLHAINGGFFQDTGNQYCRSPECNAEETAPELGAEMWAYVPYNLQPNLKCLTSESYSHRYYVDLKPRIFDARIFPASAVHPNGWGTLMVAGMRLGGSTVDAVGNGAGGNPDTRLFTSAYMVFDITDPEQPPVLMGELTYNPGTSAAMGFTTPVPTVVPMKVGDTTKWYLVLGSGPTTLDGQSDQSGKIAVFPLDELSGGSPAAFRIPNSSPSPDKGRWTVGTGFISDLITVDFDIEKNYRGDAVYFGTVEGDWGNWSGKMYRIATNADSTMTAPGSWSEPKVLLDPGRPITSAASVGWDGSNYWIYFGTGRFFDTKDKSDTAQNYYFGVKEPVNCFGTQTLSWDTVDWDPAALTPALLRTDQIQVQQSSLSENAALSCVGGGTSCLPSGVATLYDLIEYVGGEACISGVPSSNVAGWYQQFPETGERNLGQATLLGGLLTFTTYVPFDDICKPDGISYLSAVYYQTGTPWHESVFNPSVGVTPDDPPQIISRVEIGHGLASTPNLHVGREEGAKAFVQTSTGAIVEIEQPNLPLNDVKSGRISWRND